MSQTTLISKYTAPAGDSIIIAPTPVPDGINVVEAVIDRQSAENPDVLTEKGRIFFSIDISFDGFKTFQAHKGSTIGGVITRTFKDQDNVEITVEDKVAITGTQYESLKGASARLRIIGNPKAQKIQGEFRFPDAPSVKLPALHNSVSYAGASNTYQTSALSVETGTPTDAGTDKCLVGSVASNKVGAAATFTVKYGGSGGTAMDDRADITESVTGNQLAHAAIYTKEGVNDTVYVEASLACVLLVASAQSYGNVDQADPVRTAKAWTDDAADYTSVTLSHNFTGLTAGCYVTCMFSAGDYYYSSASIDNIDADNTIYNQMGSWGAALAVNELATGTSVSISADLNSEYVAGAAVGIVLNEGAGGGGPTNYDVTIADGIEVDDSANRSAQATRQYQDSAAISSFLDRSVERHSSVFDSLLALDSLARSAERGRRLDDNFSVTDSLSRTAERFRLILDTVDAIDVLISEVTSGAQIYDVTISDFLSVTDGKAPAFAEFRRQLLQQLDINESIISLPGILAALFTATNGTAITSYNPDIDQVGGGFIQQPGTNFTISGNKLVCAASHQVVYADVDTHIVDVEFEFNAGGVDNRCGVLLHYSGTWGVDNNSYELVMLTGAATNNIRIDYTVNGSGGTLDQTTMSLDNNTTYRLRGTIDNSGNIKFYVDDVLKLEITNTDVPQSNFHGIYSALRSAAGATYDRLIIRHLSTGAVVYDVTLSEAVSVTDGKAPASSEFNRDAIESISIATILRRYANVSRFIQDSATVNDEVDSLTARFAAVFDFINVDDSIDFAVERFRVLQETTDLTDTLSALVTSGVIFRTVSDHTDVYDLVERFAFHDRKIEDTLSVADVIAREVTGLVLRTISESVETFDSLRVNRALSRLLSDDVELTDAAKIAREMYRVTKEDSISVTDKILLQKLYAKLLQEYVSEIADALIETQNLTRDLKDYTDVVDSLIPVFLPLIGEFVTGILFAVKHRLAEGVLDIVENESWAGVISVKENRAKSGDLYIAGDEL